MDIAVDGKYQTKAKGFEVTVKRITPQNRVVFTYRDYDGSTITRSLTMGQFTAFCQLPIQELPTRNYLDVTRFPRTFGDTMRMIGRYTQSEGGDSMETRQARADLFDVYETWCQLDRPEFDAVSLTEEQRAKFEAAAERGLAYNREQKERNDDAGL